MNISVVSIHMKIHNAYHFNQEKVSLWHSIGKTGRKCFTRIYVGYSSSTNWKSAFARQEGFTILWNIQYGGAYDKMCAEKNWSDALRPNKTSFSLHYLTEAYHSKGYCALCKES